MEKKGKENKEELYKITRRKFLKGVGMAAGSVAIGSSFLLSGCTKEVEKTVTETVTQPTTITETVTATTPILSPAPDTAIDAFCHVIPPEYAVVLQEQLPADSFFQRIFLQFPELFDLEARFGDSSTEIQGYKQVLSCVGAPLEEIADPERAAELAQLANDGLAELVETYPDRFIAALAYLPMNNMEAALEETDRCINELGMKGIMIYTPINDKGLDSPEFIPLYEKMVQYDLPIFVHPWRGPDYPDYRTETISQFQNFNQWGWDYELTIAQARLVYSGIIAKYPTIKFVFHHGGSMVPFLQRFTDIHSPSLLLGTPVNYAPLFKPAVEYYNKFYVDTSSLPASGVENIGSTILEVPYHFYGADRVLFATDYPFPGSAPDPVMTNIRGMRISDEDKKKIFETNIKTLLKLP